MAVDRGGMRYGIEAVYESRKAFTDFRADVDAARKDWAKFKAELAGQSGEIAQATRALDLLAKASTLSAQAAQASAKRDREAMIAASQRARAITDANKAFDKKLRSENAATVSSERNFATERKLANAALQRARAEAQISAVLEARQRTENLLAAAKARNVRLSDEELKRLKLLSEEEKRLLASRQARTRAQQGTNPELVRINAETEALRRQARAQQEIITRQILSNRGLSPTGEAVPRQEARTIMDRVRDFLSLDKAIKGAKDRADQSRFSFQRLFATLGAFTAARGLLVLFQSLVREAIKFNGQVEQIELGIAGIISATADIRDINGAEISAEARLAVARKEARRQTQLLRIDALNTATAFEELAEAFQVSIAPGIAAGFDIDQVRAFTNQITLAAKAIGLSENQLAEEIRSILQGTIQSRNTRIATALRISNEDIARAKEAGNLFDFLTTKFQAFNVTAKEATRTLPGLISRIQAATKLILGAGAQNLTDDLKQQLAEIFDSLIEINQETGEISFSPQAVQIVALIAEGLRTAVSEAQALRESFSPEEAKTIADAIGDVIGALARLGRIVIEGILQGVTLTVTALRGLGNFLRTVFGIDIFGETFREILTTIVAIRTISFALTAVWKTLLLLAGGIRLAWVAVRVVLASIVLAVRGIALAFGLLRGSAVALSVATGPLTVQILALTAAFAALAVAIQAANSDIAKEGPISRAIAEQTLKAGTFIDFVKGLATGNKELAASAVQARKDIDKMFADDRGLRQNFLKEQAEKGTGPFNKIKSFFKELIGDVKDVAIALREEDSTEGLILGIAAALEQLEQKLKDLRDQARSARGEALADLAAIGVPGEVGSQTRANEAAAQRALIEMRDLERDRVQALEDAEAISARLNEGLIEDETELARLEGLRNALMSKAVALREAEAQLVEGIARVTASELLASSARLNFETQQALAVQKIEAANARLLRTLEEQGSVRARVALLARQEFDIEQEKNAQAKAERLSAISETNRLLELQRERLAVLEQIPEAGRTSDDTEALGIARSLIVELEEQRNILQEQSDALTEIAIQEEARLERAARLTQLAADSPVLAGIGEGFAQAFDEVADLFQDTINIMTAGIQGFSAFAAHEIVRAFDPSDDEDLLENFARFLQSLSEMILQTMIQLAVTAIALNAASGGFLGPFLQNFVNLRQGRHEGGPAVEGRHDGGRAERNHRRKFRGARGYFDGGSPIDRHVHGVDRPLGLHPSDTIPLWAGPEEWIIRGEAVRKAGADAAERFNQGFFDPLELRAALGLSRYRKPKAVNSARLGFVEGGSAGSAMRTNRRLGSRASGDQIVPLPVLIADDQGMKQILDGGGNYLMRWLSEKGIKTGR